MAHIKTTQAGAVIQDIAEAVVQRGERTSIFHDEEVHTNEHLDPPGVTTGGERPTAAAVGTGTSVPNAPVLSNIPNAFTPGDLVAQGLSADGAGTPRGVRRATATPRYIRDVLNDVMAVYIQWAPPLIDTAGMWLTSTHMDSHSGVTTTEDSIANYILSRTNQATGETVTVGVVAHNEEYIATAKAYLFSNALVIESGSIPTFDPSVLDTNGEVVMPGGAENYFTYADTTAQYGQVYHYFIQAITAAQIESEPIEVVPSSAVAEGAVDLQVGTTWGSSYPDLTSPNGSLAFVDLTVNTSGITDKIEVGIIAILANALVVDTSPDPANDPHVVSTDPSEIKLYAPTAGSAEQLIKFRGANMELAGGIKTITFAAGITMNMPLASNVVKTRVAATDEWDYVIRVTVLSTAKLGPITMNLTCNNDKTAYCSAIKVEQGATAGLGATFTVTKFYYKAVELEIVIPGQNMDRIDHLELISLTDGTSQGSITGTKAANSYTFTFDPPDNNGYKVVARYINPYGTSGKDTAVLQYNGKGNPKDWSSY